MHWISRELTRIAAVTVKCCRISIITMLIDNHLEVSWDSYSGNHVIEKVVRIQEVFILYIDICSIGAWRE